MTLIVLWEVECGGKAAGNKYGGREVRENLYSEGVAVNEQH